MTELTDATPFAVATVHRTASGPLCNAQPDNAAKVVMFGLEVRNTTMDEALDWIVQRVQKRQKSQLNFVNAHCINTASRDLDYQRALRAADRLLPDGSGIKLAMRMQGTALIENLNGTDLFPQLCDVAATQGFSLFLLGAAPGVAQQAAVNMQRRVPGLRVAGTHDGYFDAQEEEAVIDQINRSRADILLVAMGVPRQELWLARNRHRLATHVDMGVGGLFDFYAERVSRAPAWLRGLGMEWTWRLVQEPARLWRRYVLGNPQFVLRALVDSLRQRSAAAPLRQSRLRASGRRMHWWLSTRATPLGRRALDLVGAATLLLLSAPLMALTALAIRLESPGPVLFSQQRIGLHGRPFRLWKFRSMYCDAEARLTALAARNEMRGGVLFKIHNDPRITRVGRLIRRLSIDELPQLWNVLRGDMALVGPRPALPAEVAQYSLTARRRLLERPGITCTWQVSGRSTLPFARQIELDLQYIHKASVAEDLRLLLKTVPAVIGGQGAY